MNELLNNFGIDWKLLVAQLINFAILFVLLRRFAYKPILNILRKRREDIEKGIKYTEEAEEKLKSVDVTQRQIIDKAKGDALAIVNEGQEIAKEKKEEAIKETVKKAEIIIADAKRSAGEEKAKMGETVWFEAQELIKAGLEKVLIKMPAKERDEELIKEALSELKASKS
ncbi:MAG: hypothetical protein A2174_03465 [Candidatus Portnoybacteria bacterium RBG_13_41_18]|uniref:ATP synthase subunit b n=1 Tax=Candidatus Portnoybacteria bacterium RBG_13_41_18 TaxID=1801991 RepID=A0A1G2F774_9BACT|nr:MAG: hypothetical protein A2174_03465 [Candidatus Portnoybacteria bacterium RBG_13_41_18]